MFVHEIKKIFDDLRYFKKTLDTNKALENDLKLP